MSYKSQNKLFSWYYITIISLVLVIGIVATIWTYHVVSSKAKEELLVNVASIASVFNKEEIEGLTGGESDLNNLNYLSLKNKLEKIRDLNKDVRFSYLWGYRNDQIYFMADSEPISSVDYSPPGQIYEEATLVEKQVFKKELSSAIEFNKDRWGSWLTALVPIMDGDKVIAVMGMDVSSIKYFKNIFVYTAIPVVSMLFVLLIIIVGFILRKNEANYLNFKEKLISMATHDLRSPLTSISWLVETTLDDKENIKNESRKNLEDISVRIKNLLERVNDFLGSRSEKDIEK